MTEQTMTLREANQNFSAVRRAAENGPVVLTRHGKADSVLVSIEEFEAMKSKVQDAVDPITASVSLHEALAMPGLDEIDLDALLPERTRAQTQFSAHSLIANR